MFRRSDTHGPGFFEESSDIAGIDEGLEIDLSVTGNAHEVVVGGGLYANRWQKHARKFVKRNTRALRDLPVWFFSSGPLDDSATETEIPPTKQVRKLMDRVGAEGHMTFGGRLEADVKGFPAGAMAKENAGDWRDPEHIGAFAEKIAADLH